METKSMSVKAWGTRGSIAISNPESGVYGGNTTCFEVFSQCFPKGMHVMLDAGTGFVPAGRHYLAEFTNGNPLRYLVLFSHYHHDHIGGLTLAPPTFVDQIPMDLYGPEDTGAGPKDMVEQLFTRPYFPVDHKRFVHKMRFEKLVDYDVHVILVHPKGGVRMVSMEKLSHHQKKESRQIEFGREGNFPIDECMLIRMAKANHSNANCISYRFEELPTGKIFVFCTDHEDLEALGADFRRHISGADLLVIDGQYPEKRYRDPKFGTASFGHGTPFGCVKHGLLGEVKKLAITHHDPTSTDRVLEEVILVEAREALAELGTDEKFLQKHCVVQVNLTADKIVLCGDYMEFEV